MSICKKRGTYLDMNIRLGILQELNIMQRIFVAFLGSHTVTVYTGNSIFAGTDANVFITLYGKYGRGEEHQLKRSSTNKNPFERGQ